VLALLSTSILGAGPWPAVHIDDSALHSVGPLDLPSPGAFIGLYRAMVFER